MEKFCQIACGFKAKCLDLETAAKLAESVARGAVEKSAAEGRGSDGEQDHRDKSGFSVKQEKTGAISTAIAGFGSGVQTPTGLIVAHGEQVKLEAGDTDDSCEIRVQCAMNQHAATCKSAVYDETKNLEELRVIQTLVGQTKAFLGELKLKENKAADEKFIIQRVCYFLEKGAAGGAKDRKSKRKVPEQEKHDVLELFSAKKQACVTAGDKDFVVRIRCVVLHA
jgi:hypothetical protein